MTLKKEADPKKCSTMFGILKSAEMVVLCLSAVYIVNIFAS